MKKKRIISLVLCGTVVIVLGLYSLNNKSKNVSVNKQDNHQPKTTEKQNSDTSSSSKSVQNNSDNNTSQNNSSKDLKKDLTLINTVPNKQGNTNGNLTNSGFAAAQGNWMFYTNEFRNSPSNLYRAMLDGETGLKKLKLGVPTSINVVNDTIYFVSKTDNYIYRLKVDGSENPVVIPTATASSICVVGDWIYYTEVDPPNSMATNAKGGIFKMKIDGSSKINIVRGSSINIEDDFIYYLKDDSGSTKIYRANIGPSNIEGRDTNETKLSNSTARNLIVDNHWIYFITEGDGLYKMKTDGTNKTKLINDSSIISFNVKDDLIYYTSSNEPSFIKKITTDGSKNDKINISALDDIQVDFIANLNIIGDYIFFNFSSGSSSEFCRVKLDGSSSKIIK